MTVLVVTHDREKEDILSLLSFLRIESDAVFANQCGRDGSYSFEHEGHRVTVHESSERGVAKNRNFLLSKAPDGFCLCIDDDCPLNEGYASVVGDFFAKWGCDVALFNGRVPYEGNRKVHELPTARVRRFRDVSYAGGPGLAFVGAKLKATGLHYDERVGYPNEVYAGEDSLFLRALTKTDLVFYRAEDLLFTVALDKQDNSSYFQGFDERFFFTRGALGKLLYPHSPVFYPLHQLLVLRKKSGLPLRKIWPGFHRGRQRGKAMAKNAGE